MNMTLKSNISHYVEKVILHMILILLLSVSNVSAEGGGVMAGRYSQHFNLIIEYLDNDIS